MTSMEYKSFIYNIFSSDSGNPAGLDCILSRLDERVLLLILANATPQRPSFKSEKGLKSPSSCFSSSAVKAGLLLFNSITYIS